MTNYLSVNANDTKVQILFYIDLTLATNNLWFGSVLLNPSSEGSVKLVSNDPNVDPIVDPALLQTEDDRITYVEGTIRLIKLIAESKVLQENGIKIIPTPVAGCGIEDEKSLIDEQFMDCVLKHKAISGWHMTSTCRMGMDAKDSVVDSNLKVHGIENLRIIDASIMPNVPRGNTNAPTSVIALYGSDMIKREHNN